MPTQHESHSLPSATPTSTSPQEIHIFMPSPEVTDFMITPYLSEVMHKPAPSDTIGSHFIKKINTAGT